MRQAVLHLDGDAFFASVEQALDPALKGRPVMTGAERGIVAALSYEAKARGITRGMPTWLARKTCPEIVVRQSDYRTYGIFSRRDAAIVRRHAPVVEEYGIDECFAGLPGATLAEGEAAARKVQADLLRELDVGYSVGVAWTKALAKVGSKWNKPLGVTAVTPEAREGMLRTLPVGTLWGVGRRMTPWFHARGIYSAYDLAAKDESWAAKSLAKPTLCLWAELRGTPAFPLPGEERDRRGSTQKTGTFWPASRDRVLLWGELSRNVERACETLREERILARGVSVFLKTQAFSYRNARTRLPRPTAYPEEMLAAIEPLFAKLYRPGTDYRATGVTLHETSEFEPAQHRLFGNDSPADPDLARLYEAVDAINSPVRRVRLGSSPGERPRERIFRLPLLHGSAR